MLNGGESLNTEEVTKEKAVVVRDSVFGAIVVIPFFISEVDGDNTNGLVGIEVSVCIAFSTKVVLKWAVVVRGGCSVVEESSGVKVSKGLKVCG